MSDPGKNGAAGVMERLMAALGTQGAVGAGRKLPPVERWTPPFCGDIDMRIAGDGTWYYMGTPISRPALVKLFSSVLKRESDRFFLVTPVEKVGITVEDAPFQALELACEGEGEARQMLFRTNADDLVAVGAEHPFRFEIGTDGGLKPYVHVRRDLWARVTRALTYDLVALGETRQVDGVSMFGVTAGGRFWPVAEARMLEEQA